MRGGHRHRIPGIACIGDASLKAGPAPAALGPPAALPPHGTGLAAAEPRPPARAAAGRPLLPPVRPSGRDGMESSDSLAASEHQPAALALVKDPEALTGAAVEAGLVSATGEGVQQGCDRLRKLAHAALTVKAPQPLLQLSYVAATKTHLGPQLGAGGIFLQSPSIAGFASIRIAVSHLSSSGLCCPARSGLTKRKFVSLLHAACWSGP